MSVGVDIRDLLVFSHLYEDVVYGFFNFVKALFNDVTNVLNKIWNDCGCLMVHRVDNFSYAAGSVFENGVLYLIMFRNRDVVEKFVETAKNVLKKVMLLSLTLRIHFLQRMQNLSKRVTQFQ